MTQERSRPAVVFAGLGVLAVVLIASLGFLWRYAQWERARGPRAAQDHLDRGVMHLQRGRANVAIQAFTEALAVDPELADAYASRGQAYLQSGDAAAAIADFSRAIDLEPDPSLSIRGRAEAFERLARLEEAAADYARLLELGGPDPALRARRGWLLVRLGDYDQAVKEFTTARDAGHAGRPALHHLAWAYWGQGHYDKAAETYTESIEQPPPGLHAWFGRGASHFHAGAWSAAAEDLARAARMVQQGQDYAILYLWLARARLEQREEADAALREFMASPRRFARPFSTDLQRFLLGELTEEELFHRARSARQQPALQGLCEAYFYTGVKRRIDGDEQTALEYFQKCMDTEVTSFYEYYGAQAELRRSAESDEATKPRSDEGAEKRSLLPLSLPLTYRP